MTKPTLVLAQEALVARLQTIIDGADPVEFDVEKVLVTNDAGLVESASREGCILVDLPNLSSENFAILTLQWDVHVIAGPPTNPLAAFDRLAQIIDVMFAAELNIDTGRPASWPGLNGSSLPAYTITLNE